MRIGQGFDVHRLVKGRRLVLGGVTIPYGLGLLGHSDADVLIHALMDALLGAIGSGDIGRHFPDNDSRYLDIDSTELLKQVMSLIKEMNYAVVNTDITVIAQTPKLASYIPEMSKLLASFLEVTVEAVNIKATTTEGLGFTGRGEGIAALAVVLLEKAKFQEQSS